MTGLPCDGAISLAHAGSSGADGTRTTAFACMTALAPDSATLPVWKGFLALLILAVASHVIHIVADARYKPDVTAQADIYPMLFPATARGIMKEHGWLDPRVEHGDKPGEAALDQRSSAASDAGRHTGAGT